MRMKAVFLLGMNGFCTLVGIEERKEGVELLAFTPVRIQTARVREYSEVEALLGGHFIQCAGCFYDFKNHENCAHYAMGAIVNMRKRGERGNFDSAVDVHRFAEDYIEEFRALKEMNE